MNNNVTDCCVTKLTLWERFPVNRLLVLKCPLGSIFRALGPDSWQAVLILLTDCPALLPIIGIHWVSSLSAHVLPCLTNCHFLFRYHRSGLKHQMPSVSKIEHKDKKSLQSTTMLLQIIIVDVIGAYPLSPVSFVLVLPLMGRLRFSYSSFHIALLVFFWLSYVHTALDSFSHNCRRFNLWAHFKLEQ